MEDAVTSARPTLVWDTPLDLPLNFQLSDDQIVREGEALLANGNYTAIRLVKYTEKTACDGCGRPRQAQQCVIIRDNDTFEEKHIGMNCLGRLYKQQADAVNAHANEVRSSRKRALDGLNLPNADDFEKAIALLSELVRLYVPHAAMHLQALSTIDTLMPSKRDQDLLTRIRHLTLYHQEWKDSPEWATRRWTALKTHPMLVHLSRGDRQKVKGLCERALANGRHLPEDEVHALNVWLKKARKWTPPFQQLVKPEDYPTDIAYEAALREALKRQTLLEGFDRVYWRSPFVNYPTDVVSLQLKRGFAVVALDHKHAPKFRRLILNEDKYRSGTRSVLIEDGPPGTHREAARYRRQGGFDRDNDNEDGSDITRKERTYEYSVLGWALVERHTKTHEYWHEWGRQRLEKYL